jgi:uncharacterized membrane protein required for colicin V production
MIPIEYLWLVLVAVFALVGMVRGLWKELGVTTILLLSLFVLKLSWDRVVEDMVSSVAGQTEPAVVKALYFGVTILFITFIAYEGITLKFPIREMKGLGKAFLGLPGGLLNGYLIVGTIWDVVNQADYFGREVPLGTSGTVVVISDYLTQLHGTIVRYLPITFVDEFVLLVLGMILLLAIILK